MLLLALDTSSAAITAAVHDGREVVGEATRVDARAHGERLAPVIAQVLAQAGVRPAELTVIAVGVGPGPFTGLRVGLVTARTMAYALGIQAYGVCSLDALAWQARGDGTVAGGPFAVATDARRREVYLAQYDSDGVRRDRPDVLRPADVAEAVRTGPVVGEGAARYPEWFTDARAPRLVGGAALASYAVEALAGDARGAGRGLGEPVPMYLRRPDVSPAGARKRVLPETPVASGGRS